MSVSIQVMKLSSWRNELPKRSRVPLFSIWIQKRRLSFTLSTRMALADSCQSSFVSFAFTSAARRAIFFSRNSALLELLNRQGSSSAFRVRPPKGRSLDQPLCNEKKRVNSAWSFITSVSLSWIGCFRAPSRKPLTTGLVYVAYLTSQSKSSMPKGSGVCHGRPKYSAFVKPMRTFIIVLL